MSSFIEFFVSLIAWQNMLFTATIGLGASLFTVQALGFFGEHESDADADLDHTVDGEQFLGAGHDLGAATDHDLGAGADHDLGAGADHDLGAGADHDLGAGADHDLGAGADHDLGADADHDLSADHAQGDTAGGGGASLLVAGMRALGVGRVPLSLLLPIALTSFGFSGLFASLALGGIGRGAEAFPEALFLPVLGAAVIGGCLTLQVASRVFTKIVPDTVKTSSDRLDLLGLVGVVKSGGVDAEFGQVKVTDAFGRELEVPCVTLDAGKAAKYGDEVVLVDWDPLRNRFRVAPFDLGVDDETRRLAEGRRRARALRSGARHP